MARQHGPVEFERIDDRQHIVTQAVGRVVLRRQFRVTGSAEAAPGHAVDVAGGGELRRELAEGVRVVAQASQENQRPARAAPVEHLQLDAFLDGDELRGEGWSLRRSTRCVGRAAQVERVRRAGMDGAEPLAGDRGAILAERAFVVVGGEFKAETEGAPLQRDILQGLFFGGTVEARQGGAELAVF